jgi:hypothetical protein
LTAPPFQAGDFVWCAFPERENPARPGALHLAYVLAVSGVTGTDQFAALFHYTTSQRWSGSALPPGVRASDREEAAPLGQPRPFVMDLRRLAHVPVTRAWFPQLDQPGSGIQGRARKALQRQRMQTTTELLTRHGELVERLGTLWPRPG